jgi:hypothetical protein
MSDASPIESEPLDQTKRKIKDQKSVAKTEPEKTDDIQEIAEKSRSQIAIDLNAFRQGIQTDQWNDLVHMMDVFGPQKAELWMKEVFEYKNGEIWTKGSLKFINEPDLNRLPRNLKVRGSLRIPLCGVKTLPGGLQVDEMLMAGGCPLTGFPEDLKLGGTLDAQKCPNLKSIPGTEYKSNVFLNDCTSLSSLPDELTVRGHLRLDNCTALEHLPSHMKVKSLSLLGCTKLKELPGDLNVEENLTLSKSMPESIKTQAETLKRIGKIKGRILYQ